MYRLWAGKVAVTECYPGTAASFAAGWLVKPLVTGTTASDAAHARLNLFHVEET
jgi:hypothetical protein